MNDHIRAETIRTSASGNHERSLRSILREIGAELAEFVDTRVQMMKAEILETLGAIKTAVPLGLLAAALFATGLLLLTLAVVSIIAIAFGGGPYGWFYAFLIVGVCWIAFAGVSAFFAINQFQGRGKFPKRTINVLKADKVWLQNEARGNA